MRGPGIYDPTTIMFFRFFKFYSFLFYRNHDQLSKINREGWVKMGFYLLSFFYYLYAYVFNFYYLTKLLFVNLIILSIKKIILDYFLSKLTFILQILSKIIYN